jgi:hypothetical protein
MATHAAIAAPSAIIVRDIFTSDSFSFGWGGAAGHAA